MKSYVKELSRETTGLWKLKCYFCIDFNPFLSSCIYVIVTSFILGSFWHKWPRCSQKNALFCQVLLNFYVENGLWTQVDGLIWQTTSYSWADKENLRWKHIFFIISSSIWHDNFYFYFKTRVFKEILKWHSLSLSAELWIIFLWLACLSRLSQ